MNLKEISGDQMLPTVAKRDFDAFLVDPVSGPPMIRPYLWWSTRGSMNPSGLGTPQLDAVLDGVRKAASESEYRAAVARLQEFIVTNPPGLFLAWGERARALNRRFTLSAEPGTDILGTDILGLLRRVRPATDEKHASRN
jgi:hypothetical protein